MVGLGFTNTVKSLVTVITYFNKKSIFKHFFLVCFDNLWLDQCRHDVEMQILHKTSKNNVCTEVDVGLYEYKKYVESIDQ